jgi:anaerobic magnesium-protoporphyrin IX monomethyl ester cyclase
VILIAHSFFLGRDQKQHERQKPYAPLTTMLAAAILREGGREVALFDATFAESVADFEAALDLHRPRIVLLIEDNFNFLTKMCTEVRRQDALAMVDAAARYGCKIAVNGPDASDHPELYYSAGADMVVPGEGEFAVTDVVSQFLGEPDSAGQRALMHIDAMPLPAWDLVDVSAYRDAWRGAHGHFSWSVAASRGCPYACNWCAKPTFGRRYSQRAPEAVADELALLKQTIASDHIWFADDIFGMTARWIDAFADAVERRDARIPFMLQSRTNLITQETAAGLQRAGAERVWLGIESGSQRILDAMDKGTEVEAARTATRLLRARGIAVGWFLQLGYPGEEWEDIVATRDLVREEEPDEIGVSVAYPLPGTVFHSRVAEELGARCNWHDTDELAMLFQGTFDTAFYRMVRDALHAEVPTNRVGDLKWRDLSRRAAWHRSPAPVQIERFA